MIAWEYINKVAATVNAVRDYENMRNVIEITPEEIKEQQGRMVSVGGGSVTVSTGVHDPRSGEKAIASAIDKIDVLTERYKGAVEYIRWFEPAWQKITELERTVLREFYMTGNQRSGANRRLQAELQYSEAQIERLRKKSLWKFSMLLFGK